MRNKFRNIWFVCAALASSLTLIVGILIYSYEGIRTQDALAEQMLLRQQLVTRAGALSLGKFFTEYAPTLTLSVISEDTSKIKDLMDISIKKWSKIPIDGIVLADSGGRVIYNVNSKSISGVGVSISDRDYYKWAKTAKSGDYYVGKPIVSRIGTSDGKYVIPVSVPVFNKQEKFNGVITSEVLVDSLVQQYSDPFKFSDKTRVYLLDADGNFIFSPITGIKGKHFSDIFGSKIDLKSGDEGKYDILLPDLENGGELIRYLVAYSKVDLNSQNWTYVIVTPASDAFLFVGPFYSDQISSLVFLTVVVIVFSLITLTAARARPKYE